MRVTDYEKEDSDCEDITDAAGAYDGQEIMRTLDYPQPRGSSYTVRIQNDKNQQDLNLLENQYYSVNLLKDGQKVGHTVLRRFSDFHLLYEILFRKNAGYIFPAFPENGLFAYVKTKVSVVKDEQFTAKRMRMVQRFFNEVFKEQRFQPQTNTDIRAFLDDGQLQTTKKIEKERSNGLINLSWGKLVKFFSNGKDDKYREIYEDAESVQQHFEALQQNLRELMRLMMDEEQQTNGKLGVLDTGLRGLEQFMNRMSKYEEVQMSCGNELERMQFQIFCQLQDLQAVRKVIDYINELSNNEENYRELRNVEAVFNEDIKRFRVLKRIKLKELEEKYKDRLKTICDNGRHCCDAL